MTESLSHFIDGRWVAGRGGRSADVFNPATGQATKKVPLASAAEIRAAVAAAAQAQPGWGATPPAKRAEVMFRFRALIERDADRLAELISSEHGKTLADAKGEVSRGKEVVDFACGIPHLLKGEFKIGRAHV